MIDFKDKKPFYPTRDESERAKDKRKVFGVSLNEAEINHLRADMKLLQQTKPSTALKQVWEIGHFVIHSDKIGKLIVTKLANLRRNERVGITNANAEIDANVKQIMG